MQITGRRKVSKGSKQTSWRRDSILECLHTLLVVFFRFFFLKEVLDRKVDIIQYCVWLKKQTKKEKEKIYQV